MTSKKTFIFFTLIFSMVYCHAQQHNELLKNTSWIQEGYGRVLEIRDSGYTYYNISTLDCKPMVEGKFNGRFKIISLNKDFLVLNPGGIVNYRFKRSDYLPATGISSKMIVTSFEQNFQVFWETFNDNYAFFKERNIDWQQVYREYLPIVRKMDSQKAFAGTLQEIVKKLNDGHIRLVIPDSLKTPSPLTGTKTVRNKNEVIDDIMKKYVPHLKSYNNGVINWGQVKDSQMGYIVIKDMNNFSDYVPQSQQNPKDFSRSFDRVKDAKEPLSQFEDETRGVDTIMKAILSDLKNTQSIIIDLRFNGGGYETVALQLLSYFVKNRKEVFSIRAKTKNGFTPAQKYMLKPAPVHYDKKVYLLLGPNTASAAEIFALGAMSYPNITRVGSRTSGIFSEILWKELPNEWEFSLSNEIYSDPKGINYEGRGIPVNIEINYPRNRPEFLESFYKTGTFIDRSLEKTLETIK